MSKSIYKIRKDLTSNDYLTVDYLGLCKVKGLKPIVNPSKPRYKTIQADRISNIYPSKTVVAGFFNLQALPDSELPQPSSKDATIAYIERMYGIRAYKRNGRVEY